MHGSNVQWCGRSYAASSSSNTVEAKKERRRISKDERRSMVKKYFNKYIFFDFSLHSYFSSLVDSWIWRRIQKYTNYE